MVRKFLIKTAIGLAFLMLFSLKFVDVTIGEQMQQYPLEMAWNATGVSLKEVSAEAWLRLNTRWMNVYDLKNSAEKIRKRFGLKLQSKMTAGEQTDFSYVTFEGIGTDGAIFTITLQSSRMSGSCETQLGMNVYKNRHLNNLRPYIENLRTQVAALNANNNFSVCLAGQYKGTLSSAMIRELSGRALRKLNADLVSAAIQDGNSSHRGYSRLLPDRSAAIAQPQVNIEVSTRYDRTRGITEISIATPYWMEGI